MQFLIDSITIEQRKTCVSYVSNDIKPTRQTIPLNRNRIIVLPTMVNKTERVCGRISSPFRVSVQL